MGKKKIKDDGVYFVGQNANDVTGSCILVKYNGKQILLECGLYQSNDYLESYNINSERANEPEDPTEPTQPTEPGKQPNTGSYLSLIAVLWLAMFGMVFISCRKTMFKKI